MEILNSFEVPASLEEAWIVLLDIPRIMPCVPGAELIEVLDNKAYKGKVTVRLGPVALSFVGTARFEDLDPVAKRARVIAKGTDSKGRGGADAVVQFHLEAAGTGTKVSVQTNVNLSGSVAQYGRGTGIIQGVATQLTNQFANNLRVMLEQERAAAVPEPLPVPAATAAGPNTIAEKTIVEKPRPAAPPPPLPQAKPISGFGLLFRALWASLLGLFVGKPS